MLAEMVPRQKPPSHGVAPEFSGHAAWDGPCAAGQTKNQAKKWWDDLCVHMGGVLSCRSNAIMHPPEVLAALQPVCTHAEFLAGIPQLYEHAKKSLGELGVLDEAYAHYILLPDPTLRRRREKWAQKQPRKRQDHDDVLKWNSEQMSLAYRVRELCKLPDLAIPPSDASTPTAASPRSKRLRRGSVHVIHAADKRETRSASRPGTPASGTATPSASAGARTPAMWGSEPSSASSSELRAVQRQNDHLRAKVCAPRW